MKKGFLLLLFFANSLLVSGQLPDGSIAPDFTATDINGNTYNLYSYLNQGVTVFLEFSATWCGPCWNYHNQGALKEIYNTYGPSGTGQVMVFFIEADPATNVACLYGPAGCNSSTQGNWVAGTPFPIIDDASGQIRNDYAINYFPTLYSVCPDGKVYEAGQIGVSGWENWIQSCSLDATSTSSDAVCVPEQGGSIDLSPTGGLPNLSFLWSNGATTEDLQGVPAGTYSCTVTESQGHFVEVGPITVSGPTTPVTITQTNQQDVNCFGEPSGSLGVAVSGGIPGYSVQWNTGQTELQISGLQAGSYTVTVTDANQCTRTETYTISQPPPLNLLLTTVSENCGQEDGTIVALASGGSPGYTYDIGFGPVPLPFFDNLSSGAYTVTITDQNNCTTTDVTFVGNIPPPMADAGPDTSMTCEDPELTIQGTGSSGGTINYNWTSPDGNIVSGEQTLTPLVDTPGTYILEVNNSGNGCVTIDTVMIGGQVEPPLLVLDTPGLLNCIADQVMIDASESVDDSLLIYTWSTDVGNFVEGDSTLTPTVDAPGYYYLEIRTADSSCVSFDSVEIIQNTEEPEVSLGPDILLDCANPEQIIVPGINGCGEYTYTLNDPEGCATISNDSIRFTTDCSGGTVELTVTCVQTGCTGSDDLTVNVDQQAPTADAGDDAQLDCATPDLVLDASQSSQGGEYTYMWTTADGNIQSGAETLNPVVDQAGTYVLEVFNQSNGCSMIDEVLVEAAPEVEASLSAQTDANCFGASDGSAEVTATGGNGQLDYLWSNGETAPAVTGLSAGVYSVTVSDASSNCEDVVSVTISEPDQLLANAQATGESDPGANDGSASAAPSGGTPDYTYLWSNGETSETITGLEPGSYTVTVTDANGCVTEQSVTVASAGCAFSVQTDVTSTSCFGGTDGSASIVIAGGQEPFSYQWSSGGQDATEENLAAGDYTVTVSDASNCPAVLQISISQPEQIDISVGETQQILCNGDQTGALTASAGGGTGNLGYLWSTGDQGQEVTGLPAGTYSVIVTDENGCENEQSYTLSQPDPVSAQLDATDESSFGANDGSASAMPQGGTPDYQYLWTTGAETPVITGLEPGTYCVTITDANNCQTTECVDIQAFNCAISAQITVDPVTCPNGDDGTAELEIVSGSSPFTFNWSSGGSDEIETNLTAGDYEVTLTDANNCEAVFSFTVEQPDELSFGEVIADIDCHGNANGSISVQPAGGTPGYTFEWNTGADGDMIDGLKAGDYSLTLTDANSCSSKSTFTITEPDELLISSSEIVNASCFGEETGSISVEATGGTGDYGYLWSNGASGSNNTGVPAGSYSVTLTDDNGCETTQSFEITEPPVLDVTIGTVQNVSCPNDNTGSASVVVSGGTPGYLYAWSSGSQSETANNLTAGLYTVDVTDANGCVTTTEVEIEANDTEAPLVSTQDVTIFLDENGNANLPAAQVDNGSTDNCNIATLVLSQSAFGCADLGDNSVTLQAADATGNTAENTATVTVLDILPPQIICPDHIMSTDCSGEVNYDLPEFDDNCSADVTLIEGPAPNESFPLGTTTVVWEAKDPSGNTAQCEFEVTVTNTLESNAINGGPACFGESNGSAFVETTGGNGGNTYIWSTGEQGQEAVELPAGFHTVTVTDQTGCISVSEITIAENPEISLLSIDVTNEVEDNQNGAITIEATGGTEPLTFEWFLDGVLMGNSNTLNNIGSGVYTLIVTDAFGCSYTEEIEVESVTSAIHPEFDRTISVYPNPTSGFVTIEIDGLTGAGAMVEIWSLDGRNLYNTVQVASTNRLDLNDLPGGVYVLKIRIDEQWTARKLTITR